MANDRIEQYLEAILEKLNDGTETGIPVPAWRIEQYLAAIYDKCGGGSSGGLPTPTNNDIGKVATVVNETIKGDVIIPEQTVTCDGTNTTPLSNTVPSLFTLNTPVIITIETDGETIVFESVVEEVFREPYIYNVAYIGGDDAYIISGQNGLELMIPAPIECSVSCNVKESAAAWGMASGVGYTIVEGDASVSEQTKTGVSTGSY